jgi:hypothetical protein
MTGTRRLLFMGSIVSVLGGLALLRPRPLEARQLECGPVACVDIIDCDVDFCHGCPGMTVQCGIGAPCHETPQTPFKKYCDYPTQ